MGGRRRRRRVEPTDDWSQLELLCRWPEQVAYEEIRPLVLFGSSVVQRSRQTRSAERMLHRKASRFEAEGMESLFASEAAKRRSLRTRWAKKAENWLALVQLACVHILLNLAVSG